MALHSMAKGMVSAPLPPGLSANGNGAASTNASANPAEGAASAASQAACDDAAVGRRAWVDERSERQALMDDVRRAVLEEIDAKVAGKMKDLWAKGNQMLKKVEQENQQKNAKMLEEIEQCRLKQDSLKAEHEHLKRVLTGMVSHFNMLGAMFGSPQSPKAVPPMSASVVAGLAAASSANGSTAYTDAPTNSSAASSTTIQDSPSSVAGGAALPPLPAVPDFPFPPLPATATPTSANGTAAVSPPQPLSLAEALGSENGPSQSVPVSLMGSLPATQQVFSFTLRKADGTDLGLNVSHHEEDKALRVEGVRPEGAVEAWNRQCIGSIFSEKAVVAGDRIISVNGVTHNPVKMLEECRDKQLLKITVLRGELAPAAKATTLRADASEFVPSIPAAPGLDPPAADEKKEKTSDSDADDAYEVVNKAEDCRTVD